MKERLRRMFAAGMAGASGLAAILGAGGCTMTHQLGGRSPAEIQWIDVNGRKGYINYQGYGIVPVNDDTGHIYEYRNGKWVNINDKVKLVTGIPWTTGRHPDKKIVLK